MIEPSDGHCSVSEYNIRGGYMKEENYRGRAYRRFQRNRAIRRKKGVANRIYEIGWFQIDGKYSKGHIGCGCWMCKPGKRFHAPSWQDARQSLKYTQAIRDYWDGTY